jgi:hypothetical protein
MEPGLALHFSKFPCCLTMTRLRTAPLCVNPTLFMHNMIIEEHLRASVVTLANPLLARSRVLPPRV